MDSYTDVILNKLLHQHKRFPESQALQDVCLLSCPKILSDKTTPFCTKGDQSMGLLSSDPTLYRNL